MNFVPFRPAWAEIGTPRFPYTRGSSPYTTGATLGSRSRQEHDGKPTLATTRSSATSACWPVTTIHRPLTQGFSERPHAGVGFVLSVQRGAEVVVRAGEKDVVGLAAAAAAVIGIRRGPAAVAHRRVRTRGGFAPVGLGAGVQRVDVGCGALGGDQHRAAP